MIEKKPAVLTKKWHKPSLFMAQMCISLVFCTALSAYSDFDEIQPLGLNDDSIKTQYLKPAPNLADAQNVSTEHSAFTSNDQHAVAGTYSENNKMQNAIWLNNHGVFQSVINSGDPIIGLPDHLWFHSTQALELATDSTVWSVVTLGGAAHNQQALIQITAGNKPAVSLRVGDSLLASDSRHIIRSFNYLKVVGTHAYLSIRTADETDYLVAVSGRQPTIISRDNSQLQTTWAQGAITSNASYLTNAQNSN